MVCRGLERWRKDGEWGEITGSPLTLPIHHHGGGGHLEVGMSRIHIKKNGGGKYIPHPHCPAHCYPHHHPTHCHHLHCGHPCWLLPCFFAAAAAVGGGDYIITSSSSGAVKVQCPPISSVIQLSNLGNIQPPSAVCSL